MQQQATYIPPGNGVLFQPHNQSAQQQQQLQQQQQQPGAQPQQPSALLQPQPLPQPHGHQQLQDTAAFHQTTTITATTQPSPPSKRGFFSIYKRRGETDTPPQPQQQQPSPLPQQQQPAQQAFSPPSPGRPSNPPPPPIQPNGAPLPPPADTLPPHDMQPLQELIGGNWIFVTFVPYFVATALQDTHLQAGLIAASVTSGAIVVLGLVMWLVNLRKVFPHILELLMPVIFVVQLGVSYHSESYKKEVIRTYPLTTHSALAGTCLLSMLVCYPVGYQTTQELVHRLYCRHTAVLRCGLYVTAFLTASFVTSCLLYLAPLCKGVDTHHWNALNLIFRLIYPCVATLTALLFVRFFPGTYLPNLAVVHGLNKRPPARMPAYLASALTTPQPPRILDAMMYKSTVDAAAKAREATTMRRAPPPLPPLTPRYGAGSAGLAAQKLVYGPQQPPGGGGGLDGFSALLSEKQQQLLAAAGGCLGTLPGVYPSRDQYGHSLYTYFAAGPPAPPPLAVYAVYGEYDAPLPQPWDPGHPVGNRKPLAAAAAAAAPRGVQPLLFGGSSRVVPYNGPSTGGGGGAYYGVSPYGNNRRGPYHNDQYGTRVYGAGLQMPGRNHASAGGAGPYGVNMPLGALAAAGTDGRLPPPGQPDANVTNGSSAFYASRYYQQQQQQRTPGLGLGPLGDRYGGGGGGMDESQLGPRQLQFQGPPEDGYGGTPYVRPEPAAAAAYDARQRYRTDGGVGYGLGAEVRQQQYEQQRYQYQQEQRHEQFSAVGRIPGPPPAPLPPAPPPPRTEYGLDAEVSLGGDRGGPQAGGRYGMPAGPAPGGLSPPRSPPRTQPDFGLDAEVRSTVSYGTPSPPPPPQQQQPQRRSPAAVEPFGLNAEVSQQQLPLPPRAQQLPLGPGAPRVKFASPPAAPPAAGEPFGLDAEVGGR